MMQIYFKGFSDSPWNEFFHRGLRTYCQLSVSPEVTARNCKRTTVIVKPVFSSSHSVLSTVGTVCPRKMWMQHQLTRSKDVWREGVGTICTFLKTDSLQVQLAARLLIHIYRRLPIGDDLMKTKVGAAALCSCTWWVPCATQRT